jgi:Holliday junction resolvasome RuvABC DNA-binding subunit
LFLIKTPNPVFFGERAGLDFKNGQAQTEDPHKAQALKALGYEVITLDKKENKVTKQEKTKKAAKKSGE